MPPLLLTGSPTRAARAPLMQQASSCSHVAPTRSSAPASGVQTRLALRPSGARCSELLKELPSSGHASGHANARSSSERARIPRDQSVTGRRAGGTEDVESVAGGDRDQPRNVRGLCKRRWQDALGRRLADLVQEALELERREPD